MALTHTPAEVELGADAADFDLPATDGSRWSLQRSRGSAGLLVAFICNHCPYVQAIKNRLGSDCAELQAVGVGVVAISSNDATRYPADGFAAMGKLAAAQSWPFPYLYDETQDVAKAYGALCTPDFFGYDSELKLRYRGRLDAASLGPRPEHMPAELVQAMRAIASNETLPASQPSVGCSIKWRS